MARWIVIALVASLAFCAFVDFRARHKYDDTQRQISLRHSELQKLADVDQQLEAHEKKKAALQHRIDVLQQLYAAKRNGH